jgi:hypothetical protein
MFRKPASEVVPAYTLNTYIAHIALSTIICKDATAGNHVECSVVSQEQGDYVCGGSLRSFQMKPEA